MSPVQIERQACLNLQPGSFNLPEGGGAGLPEPSGIQVEHSGLDGIVRKRDSSINANSTQYP